MKIQKEISATFMLVWPLLFGMFMIMVGNGLQGTLLSLRAKTDGFPVSVIGIVMSLYYCGYLAGWYIVPRMIKSVGHIRVFAGFASMASTTVLIQGLFVDPYIWGVVRILSGISFVGLFIVAESWLNNISTNKLRGRIFSGYLFVVNGGILTGQFLINLAPIEEIHLFVLISVLISLSLVPITLADKPSPGYEEPEQLPIRKVFAISPYSVAAIATAGFGGAAALSLGPVYAAELGYGIGKISLFIASFVLGCALVPLVCGWLSDLMDRRRVIIIMSLIGTAACFSGALFNGSFIILVIFIFGGCVSSVYSVSVAMMNDRLKPSQITSATATLILIAGLSSCIAPILIGTLMQLSGPHSFFYTLTTIFMMLFIYGLYRAYTGPEIDIDDQSDFKFFPARASPAVAQISTEQHPPG